VNLGIYCETISPRELSAPDVLKLLGRFRATLGHALIFADVDAGFDPDRVQPHLELAAKLREAGGRYGLWPLLPKPLGYWVNERNLDAVERMVDALLEGGRRFGAHPDLLIIDMETPWTQMEAVGLPGRPAWRRAASLLRYLFENRKPKRYAAAVRRLSNIVRRWQAEASPVSAAVTPFLVADLINDGHTLQDYLETPVWPVPFDGYNTMFYNSYLPQMTPVLVDESSAQRFLFEYASTLKTRLQDKAWVTLGSTWEGVIPGNAGKVFNRPEHYAADVAAAKAAGVETIWLYCLEGVLFADHAKTVRRKPKESAAFFEVIRDTEPARPPVHAKLSRNLDVFHWLLKDRRRASYGWND